MRLLSANSLFAFLSLLLAGCTSFTPQQAADENTRNRWVLDQEKDSTRVVTLVRGMTPAQVTGLLGQPAIQAKSKKAERPTEEWTFRRYTLGGYSIISERAKGGYMTAHQRMTYVETLELTFVDGQLTKVRTTRYREDIEPASPLRRL